MSTSDMTSSDSQTARRTTSRVVRPSEPAWIESMASLDSNAYMTAFVHYYRAEVSRASTWRTRLDVTTNWAVISTGAAISFAFGQPDTHHSVILLILILVTLFLFIEARRYRHYELWSYRVRLVETDFYAAMLTAPFRPLPGWSAKMATSLLTPQFPITLWEAVGQRLRRNYIWIYLILDLAWLAKLLLFPTGATSPGEFLARASLGIVAGTWVVLAQALTALMLVAVMLLTLRRGDPSGEAMHREAEEIEQITREMEDQTEPE